MATPHIAAAKDEVAETILMPGDPLRAKFIAEQFLNDIHQINNIRGMLGYTGRYKGAPVSVMGSGMGMPSIGIYSYELYTQYHVENIIRVGSAGSYTKELKLFDLMLVTASYSESSFARTQNGYEKDTTYPSEKLCAKLRTSAGHMGVPLVEGTVHSTDVFYQEQGPGKPYWEILCEQKGCLAVEMESFALFHNAAVAQKGAACLLTISDSFVTSEKTTAEQREKNFTDMMKVALGTL